MNAVLTIIASILTLIVNWITGKKPVRDPRVARLEATLASERDARLEDINAQADTALASPDTAAADRLLTDVTDADKPTDN